MLVMPANIIVMPADILVMPANIIVMPASERASPYTIFYNYSREQFAGIYLTPVH